MSIPKAILLTLLIAAIEVAVQLVFFIGFDTRTDFSRILHLHGMSILLGRPVAYLFVFLFFWKAKLKDIVSVKKASPFPSLLILFLILIGHELLSRPFFDYREIRESFSSGGLQLYNYSFEGYTPYFIYRAISALLLAPVLEEIFFRKFLLPGLLLKYKRVMALTVSSLLFSLIHWETPENLVPAFLFGLISGTLYLRTGNIGWSILLHGMANLLSLLLEIKGELYYQWLYWLDFGYLYWTLFGTGLLLTLFSLKWLPSAEKVEVNSTKTRKIEQ